MWGGAEVCLVRPPPPSEQFFLTTTIHYHPSAVQRMGLNTLNLFSIIEQNFHPVDIWTKSSPSYSHILLWTTHEAITLWREKKTNKKYPKFYFSKSMNTNLTQLWYGLRKLWFFLREDNDMRYAISCRLYPAPAPDREVRTERTCHQTQRRIT